MRRVDVIANHVCSQGDASGITSVPLSAEAPIEVKHIGNGAAVVTMKKAPVNTFDKDMMLQFEATIKQLEGDKSVQGIILCSGRPRVFSAGLDLSRLVRPDRADFEDFWSTFESMWRTYFMSSLVTVCAVNGSCPALGAVLALSSDYRVMANNGKYTLGLNETSIGMVPPLWLHELCDRTLGHRAAERHLQLSTMMPPSAALEA